MTQRIEEQIGTLPAIESELHLFQVGWEMLGANPVPCTHDAALEKREGRFDGVGVNVAHDIHARTVVNFFMVRSFGFPHGGIIRGRIIGENYFHILADVLADVLRERSAFGISGMEEAEIAIALADAYHYLFVVVLCDVALAAIDAANVGHIHFDLAVKHRLIGLRHCVPDAVTEIPRCFVSPDSQSALNLASRHALLRLAKKKSCSKPRRQRQVRVIENRSSGHRKLVVTVLAVEEMLFGFEFDHRAFAAQAARAFREAQARQKFAALSIGREERVYIH